MLLRHNYLMVEAGEQAHQLIEGFMQGLKRTPEFLQALGDQYFSQKALFSDDRFKNVVFKKGDAQYVVDYEKMYNEENDLGRERLRFEKFPANPKSQNEWWSESVNLWSYTINKNTQFEKGTIRLTKCGEKFDKEPDIPQGTQSAIQEVQKVLRTNFGYPQAQTTPQK